MRSLTPLAMVMTPPPDQKPDSPTNGLEEADAPPGSATSASRVAAAAAVRIE